MNLRSITLLTSLLLGFMPQVFALSPVAGFEKKEQYGSVTNYRHDKLKVDLGSMSSELKYEDLGPDSIEDVKKMIVAKQEYGKVFGFQDWKMSDHKFTEHKGHRVLVIQGEYKDNSKQTVYFLEVYWANQQKSGQYLVTSDHEKMKAEDFNQFLQ
jgi:hypothetical protein